MRLLIVFSVPEEILIPWNYLDWLRGLIYSLLRSQSSDFAQWLHQEGTTADNKRYKPFTFSLLYPANKKTTKKGLLIKGEVNWFISSPIPLICQLLADELLHSSPRLGPYKLEVLKVASFKTPPLASPSHFNTLSPISISTGIKDGDKLRKIFVSPEEDIFPKLLKENLLNKAEALWLPKGEIEIEAKPPFRSRLFKIRGIDVRGWDMQLTLRGDEHLIRLAYEVGLGEHNACG
ncbi:MAG: CRISPR-associated endoribonuclease Cas6, partial [bacterium]